MAALRMAFGALALSLAAAVQAEYSWELSAFGSQAERDNDTRDTDITALSATHYFDPVEDERGPYALAAFFDPATSVSLAVSEERQTSRTFAFGGLTFENELETSDYTVAGQYLLPQSKWFFGGRYTSEDTEIPVQSTVVTTTDSTIHGVFGGKYFGDGATRLEAAVDRSDRESESSEFYCAVALPCSFFNRFRIERVTDTARIGARHVRRPRALTYALFGDVAETRSKAVAQVTTPPIVGEPLEVEAEPVREYTFGAELFPTAKLGVRLEYTRFDGQTTAADDAATVAASWFFRRNIGVELTLSRQEFVGFVPTNDVVGVRVTGRL